MRRLFVSFLFALCLSWSGSAFGAAIEYVDSSLGTGNNDGTTWVNAWRSADGDALASALANCNAGGTIYVISGTTQTMSGDTTFASANGVAGNPVTIISVKTGAAEPPAAGDYETMTTGGGKLDGKTGGAWDISLDGFDIWIGIEFHAGDEINVSPTNGISVKLINCKILVDDQIIVSNGSNRGTYFEDVDIEQVTAGYIYVLGDFIWWKGSYSFNGGAIATNLFTLSGNGDLIVADVDIQNGDAGDYIVSDDDGGRSVLIKRCKIPAAMNYMNNGPTRPQCKVKFHSVASGNSPYVLKEYYFEGLIESDTDTYLDATYDGTNGYSVLMTTDADAVVWTRPLRFKLADVYVSAINKTLTVELLSTDGVAATTLHTNDVWLEVEYPDSTIAAYGNILSTRAATILSADVELTASAKGAGDWTGELANNNFYKLVADFTGVADEAVGVYTVWACQAIPSESVYYCPKITVN